MIDAQSAPLASKESNEPAPGRFEELHDAHVAMLTGSLLEGVETGPDGALYVFSETIPDPTLNFASHVRSAEQRDWAVDAARRRGRQPAFLARDDVETDILRRFLDPEAVFRASWMEAEPAHAAPIADRAAVVERHAEPEPPESFCEVFAALSGDAKIRAHLQDYYLPSLRGAQTPDAIEPVHLVIHDDDGPAACASLYVRDGLAGLYNVSTRADRQRRGLGAAVTALALAEGGERAASRVFLQCPADGFVERLYASIGFRTVCSPSLVCMTAP